MKETLNREALKALERTFGDRIRPVPEDKPDLRGAAASVTPLHAEEVRSLAKIAQTYSIPLAPLGAETTSGPVESGSLLVRFDLMRRTRFPEDDELWIEAEPGTVWLEMEDELRTRGRGLAVYPTSAPRATVGGWLAMNGLGVGSFEYGWLSENVLNAAVVLPGGELREVPGRDLPAHAGSDRTNAIVVGARLRTRSADTDTPFAAAFEDPEALAGAVMEAGHSNVPLWHLAFLNPVMARLRGLGESYLLFGAYPKERTGLVDESLHLLVKTHGGETLPANSVHRIWTERFFPVAPAHDTPTASRAIVYASQLPDILTDGALRERAALQGTVARSGEVLLLTFEPDA